MQRQASLVRPAADAKARPQFIQGDCLQNGLFSLVLRNFLFMSEIFEADARVSKHSNHLKQPR